ncbi:hypothetical protein LINGRAHAP2_LOCUS14463 [Linum grandiflorum]
MRLEDSISKKDCVNLEGIVFWLEILVEEKEGSI